MKSSMIRVVGLTIAVATFCLAGGSARADTMLDFEGTLPANVYLQGFGNGTAATSTDYNHTVGGTTSAKLSLTDIGSDEARVKIAGVGGLLGATAVNYWVYEPVGASITDVPYLELYVDTNNNGVSDGVGVGEDSYVITSPTTPLVPGQWVQETLTADTLVHVVGERNGLGEDETAPGALFSAYNGFGKFGDLCSTSYPGGSYTWGDMTIFNAYIDTGAWGGRGGPYTAYVDDIQISPVPEPSTFAMLSTLGFVLLGYAWRRR